MLGIHKDENGYYEDTIVGKEYIAVGLIETIFWLLLCWIINFLAGTRRFFSGSDSA